MADTGLGAAIEAAINAAVQKALSEQKTGQPILKQTEEQQSQEQGQNQPYQMTEANIATPTDVSDITTPIANKGSMKVNEYVSPYQKEQQQLVKDLGAAKLYETPQTTNDFIANLFKQQTKEFQYDKENDPLVVKARKEVEQAVKNMAVKRGFAFGSQEQDIIAQQMAKVEPTFEQIAYNENADFLNRQLGLASTIIQWEKIQFDRSKDQVQLILTKLDFINRLDDREFEKFKIILEQRNFNRTALLNQQKFDLQKKLVNQEQALNRLDIIGYVDKQASVILGVPIGTKAKWVQQITLEQQNKLELMARENQYNIAKQKLDAQIEKELYALKNKLDTESQLKLQAQTYNYKKQLQKMEYDYLVKKQKIEKEQAEEEARIKAAEKAAAEAAKYVGGDKSTGQTASQLKRSYYAEVKKFVKKFKSKKKQKSQAAAKYLKSLKSLGVSDAVIAMIRNNYNVPAYHKVTESEKRTSEAKANLKKFYKTGKISDLWKGMGTK